MDQGRLRPSSRQQGRSLPMEGGRSGVGCGGGAVRHCALGESDFLSAQGPRRSLLHSLRGKLAPLPRTRASPPPVLLVWKAVGMR